MLFTLVTKLEAAKDRRAEDEVDAGPNQPPVFMDQLNKVGEVVEGQSVHLDARLEPKNDPKLRLEWELNGKPLTTGRGGGERLRTITFFARIYIQTKMCLMIFLLRISNTNCRIEIYSIVMDRTK